MINKTKIFIIMLLFSFNYMNATLIGSNFDWFSGYKTGTVVASSVDLPEGTGANQSGSTDYSLDFEANTITFAFKPGSNSEFNFAQTFTFSGGTLLSIDSATLTSSDTSSTGNQPSISFTSNSVSLSSVSGTWADGKQIVITLTTTASSQGPTITSTSYNASAGTLVVTGTDFEAKSGASNDVTANKFTFTGEGGSTYTLTDTPDVEITSATEFTLVLSATDKAAVNQILNKNGTSSTSGTTYNISAADDYMANVTSDDTSSATNALTVSSIPTPTITSATYDATTGSLILTGTNFVKKSGATNDIDVTKLTLLGQDNNSYTLTSTSVEITNSTSATISLNATDKLNVNGILNKDGTTAVSGTTYNLSGAEDWMAGYTGTDADTLNNTITVSNVSTPTITSATYDVSAGVLSVTGTNLVKKSGATNDIAVSSLTLTGEGSTTRTLTTSDVEITSATSFSITLNSADKSAVNLILNKNGTSSTDSTTYNLSASDDWNSIIGNTDISDTSNGITVSNVSNPTITSSTYDATTGVFTVTGTGFVSNAGATNDVDITKLTILGEGSNTYTLTSSSVEVTNNTSFTVTLNSTDKLNINGLLNKNGTSSGDITIYNLSVADDWMQGALASNDISDTSGNGITVSNVPTPTITSATYDATTGVLVVTGTNFVKKSGALNDIDLSKLTITGQGSGTRTLTTSDVEISSSTSFTVTLVGGDKTNVNILLDKDGTTASDSVTYNLAAADDWLAGYDSSANIAEATNTITVTGVNNIPTFTSFSTFIDTVNEDTEVEITLTELKAQGDEADSDGTVDAFVVQAVSTGILKIGASSGTATAYASGTNDTIDSTNKAYWTPAQDANGTLNAFTLKAKDDKNSLSSTAVQGQVSVTAVNDTPTLTLPSTPSINEDASNYAIENTINVTDVDDDNITVTITATNGTISVNTSSVGSFITGDGTDDGVIKFTETVANVNTVLDSLTFSPTKDFDGTASVKVDIDDSTAFVVSDTLSITVKNAPEITSITRGNPVSEKTNADSLVFNVNISDQGTTTGADTTDFQVTGGSTAVVSNVTRQSVYYQVTVSGGNLASYSGTVGLNFIDNNSMTDNGVPIGGDGVDSFTTGETYTLDNTAPTANLSTATDDVGSVTGTLSSGDKTDDTALVLAGTNETGSSVSVYNGATLLGTATVTGTTWSYTATVADGTTYQFNVKETDSAGNESSATSNFTVIGDTTAPIANLSTATDDVGSVTGTLSSGDKTDDTALVLAGTNETGSSVSVYNGATLLGTATVTGTTWSYTATVADGTTYQFNVKETDSAGNESSATSNFTVIGDTSAPNAPLAVDLSTSSDTGSSNNDNATSDTTPTFTGTAEANSTITLISSIDGTIGTTTADGSGNWSITASTLSAGNHNITVTATDSVGNTSSASIALAVTIDNTTPTIVVSPSKSTAINGEVIDLTFTLSEDSSDFIVNDISVVGGSLSEFTQSTSNTKVYTAKLTIDDTTTTQATIDVNASKFTDSVGNANSAATQKAITIFPSVVKLTPTKDSTDAALNSDLKIEFSEEVVKGTTGSINIHKTSNDGLVETIDINDSKITIENPNSTNGLTNTTVTIAKATQLDLVTGYYVTISNTAFKDVNGNLFEGISAKTTWAFTTIDNQAPTISNNSSNATATISVDENQTAVVDVDATDPDLGQTLTYSISGTDASSFDVDSTTGVITFKTAPDYETKSSYSITVKASDDSTVSLSDTQALTVNINDVNEAPTSSNNSFTINEDTTKTFASTDFAFSDVDNANTLNSIKIVTLPSKGTLQLNSSDVVVNQSILKADISKLIYTPVANENGSSYSSFTFKVNDGNLDSTSAYTMTVNVTAVDDAPEITTTLNNQTQVEDGEGLVISLSTSDIDSDASTATYAVTSSDENIATAYIRDGKLIVVPQKNASGNVTITLTSTVGGKSTTKTFTYTLTGVNDAPTISSIDDITHKQTSSVINETITFDIWDDVEVTSLTATSSNQSLLPNSSIVIPSAPYGSQSTLTYTISAANAGKADITVVAKDAQGLSYSESFKITVDSQSDAQCVENTKTALTFDTIKLNNSFQNALNSNLDLVTGISSVCDDDATISWETTDSNVIDTNGAVTQGSDKTIMLTANITKGEFSTKKEFLVTVLPSSISASEALSKLTFETIKEQNSSKSTIISKLNLPTSILGEDIIWTSSDDSVISPYSGYVTRSATEDKEVTLTATIGSESKTFALTVLKEETSDANSVNKDKDILTIDSILGNNTDKNSIINNLLKPLPTTGANGSTISWSSSNTAFITNEGDVLRDANANKIVVLTATITKGSQTTTKEFTFQVLQNKIDTETSNEFKNAGTTTDGTQVTTTSSGVDTQTKSSFASTILNTVDTIVSQGNIRSIVEVAKKIVNVYLNTDGTTKSTLQSTTGSASLENKNVGSTTNVEDDGDIVSSNSDDTIRLKISDDGTDTTVSHEVVNNTVSKTSTATSKVANSSVRSDESGNVETTSEVKKDGYVYKAVVSTNTTGETTTKFVRVDLSTGEQDEVDNTVSSSTPFQAGNEVTITEDDDGNLYIKTTTPLDGNLEIE